MLPLFLFGVVLSLLMTGSLLVVSGCVTNHSQSRIIFPDEEGRFWEGRAPTVVIDAGHGGHDPGAEYGGVAEKDLALTYAVQLQQHLRTMGFRVRMTRSGDVFVALSERIRLANELPADLFVSIHLNANHNPQVQGAEVYYASLSELQDVEHLPPGLSQKLASHNRDTAGILWDLIFDRRRWESEQVAGAVCSEISQRVDVACKAKPARFVVLRQAQVPAILVEVGYLSHAHERVHLLDQPYQQAMVHSIASGIYDFLKANALQAQRRFD